MEIGFMTSPNFARSLELSIIVHVQINIIEIFVILVFLAGPQTPYYDVTEYSNCNKSSILYFLYFFMRIVLNDSYRRDIQHIYHFLKNFIGKITQPNFSKFLNQLSNPLVKVSYLNSEYRNCFKNII